MTVNTLKFKYLIEDVDGEEQDDSSSNSSD